MLSSLQPMRKYGWEERENQTRVKSCSTPHKLSNNATIPSKYSSMARLATRTCTPLHREGLRVYTYTRRDSLSRQVVACPRRYCRQLCLALSEVWFPFSGNPCHEEDEWDSRLYESGREWVKDITGEHHEYNTQHIHTRENRLRVTISGPSPSFLFAVERPLYGEQTGLELFAPSKIVHLDFEIHVYLNLIGPRQIAMEIPQLIYKWRHEYTRARAVGDRGSSCPLQCPNHVWT